MLLGYQLLRQENEADAAPERQRDVLPWSRPQIHKRPKTDEKHQENIDKGLAARQAVGIMESVPDKIQDINGKAGEKEQDEPAVNRFFPDGNLGAAKIQKKEH